MLCVNLFIGPVNTLIGFMEQYQNGQTGFKRFYDIITTEVEKDDEDAVSVSWEEAIDCGHYNSLTELLDSYDYFNELADETKDTLNMTADQLSRFIDTNEGEILKLIPQLEVILKILNEWV